MVWARYCFHPRRYSSIYVIITGCLLVYLVTWTINYFACLFYWQLNLYCLYFQILLLDFMGALLFSSSTFFIYLRDHNGMFTDLPGDLDNQFLYLLFLLRTQSLMFVFFRSWQWMVWTHSHPRLFSSIYVIDGMFTGLLGDQDDQFLFLLFLLGT